MYFKRKAYDKLIEWKENYANEYAALFELCFSSIK